MQWKIITDTNTECTSWNKDSVLVLSPLVLVLVAMHVPSIYHFSSCEIISACKGECGSEAGSIVNPAYLRWCQMITDSTTATATRTNTATNAIPATGAQADVC